MKKNANLHPIDLHHSMVKSGKPDKSKKWVGSGWKMSKDAVEAITFAEYLSSYIYQNGDWRKVAPFVMVPSIYLREVAAILVPAGVTVAAQNVHWETRAEITGEVSARMLFQAGAGMVLIGHRDRRQYFNETDPLVNRKTLACLNANLVPIICVGEPEEEREYGSQDLYISRQVRIALHDVPPDRLDDIAILYEPNWSIGLNGVVPSVEYVQGQVEAIRHEIGQKYGLTTTDSVHVLYGGSIDKQNAFAFISEVSIDGLGIGRAGRDPAKYISILNSLETSLM